MTRSIKILSLLILLTDFYTYSMKTAISNETIVSELDTNPRLLLDLPDEILGTIIKKCINEDCVFDAIKMLIQVSWVCKNFEHLSKPNKIKTILCLNQTTLDHSFDKYASDLPPYQKPDNINDFTPILKLLIAMNAYTNIFYNRLDWCVKFSKNAYFTKYFIMHHDNKIDQQDDFGYTPLHWAIEFNKPNIVKVLLEHNANMYLTDNYKKTPTYYALSRTCLECIKVLIDHGLDTSIEYNWSGSYKQTIAEWAKARKHHEIYKLVTGKEIPSDTCIIS